MYTETASETSRYLKLTDYWVRQRLAQEDAKQRLERMEMEVPPSMLESIHLLDVMLVRSPRMTQPYGLMPRMIYSLRLVDEFVDRMKQGESLSQIHDSMETQQII